MCVAHSVVEVLCSVESVKAVAEVYLPISGKLLAINEELSSSPALVNTDPYNEGNATISLISRSCIQWMNLYGTNMLIRPLTISQHNMY